MCRKMLTFLWCVEVLCFLCTARRDGTDGRKKFLPAVLRAQALDFEGVVFFVDSFVVVAEYSFARERSYRVACQKMELPIAFLPCFLTLSIVTYK